MGTLTVSSATVRGITRYTIAWTSTAGGAVSGNPVFIRAGELIQVKFVPASGGTQPSDLYDVTLVDANSVDVLDGRGANLSNANAKILQWDPPLYVNDSQTLDLVVAAAGNAKTGQVVIWLR